MITIVVVVLENTSCRAIECYVYMGPDNKETRKKAEDGFVLQVEEIQGNLNPDQEAYYREKKYYPGAYYTVCLIDSPDIYIETEEEKQKRLIKEEKSKKIGYGVVEVYNDFLEGE